MRLIIKFIIIAIGIINSQWNSNLAFARMDRDSLSDVNVKGFEKNESKYKWGKDPFITPLSERFDKKGGASKIDGMALSGIILRKGGGVAIINNKIMKKGDVIGGKRLIEILGDRVILADGDERIELLVERFSSTP